MAGACDLMPYPSRHLQAFGARKKLVQAIDTLNKKFRAMETGEAPVRSECKWRWARGGGMACINVYQGLGRRVCVRVHTEAPLVCLVLTSNLLV